MMQVLKGADVVSAINETIKKELETMTTIPKLAIIRVGEKGDDISYERGATKRMATVGIRVESFVFPEDISHELFQKAFDEINVNPDIDGILLLRPLPRQIDEKEIEKRINPLKDVDGISPLNLAKVFAGEEDGFAPCTAQAVVEMLRFAEIPLEGKRVTIVGRSMVVGKPLAMLLMKENCTVTVCHTRTVDLEETCQHAEILVAAVGRANHLNAAHVGKGSIVIDVGINVDEYGKLCGDVEFNDIASNASLATPVPGGVGTVTTSVLAKNVVKAHQLLQKLEK